MTTATESVALQLETVDEEGRPPSARRAVLASWEGRIGLGLGLVVLFVIAFGRFFTPYPPNAINTGPPTAPPSSAHLLGTDDLSRDVFSRLLVGGGTIILIPLIAVSLAWLIGGTLGMLAAYRGGKTDAVITRTYDLLMSLPPLLIVLVAIAALGTSSIVLVLTIMLVYLPRMGRLVRGATQGVITSEYVAAAQARGERTGSMLFREILPNIMAPTTADFALRITYAVIFVATLNFLGLGVQPPKADWGVMVAQYRGFITLNPVATLAPAAMIALLSISLNLVADALTQHVTRGKQEIVQL
jgi:ABC-type dipeptide/oligopeptide/nickel transport system permease subunit